MCGQKWQNIRVLGSRDRDGWKGWFVYLFIYIHICLDNLENRGNSCLIFASLLEHKFVVCLYKLPEIKWQNIRVLGSRDKDGWKGWFIYLFIYIHKCLDNLENRGNSCLVFASVLEHKFTVCLYKLPEIIRWRFYKSMSSKVYHIL